jgi:hypothetical protein
MRNRTLIVLLAVSVMLALGATAQAASFTLTGNYLNVGISDSGATVTDTAVGYVSLPPAGTVGIQFDPTGTGTFPQARDFVVPGITFEYFSIGVGGANYMANGAYLTGGQGNGYQINNPMGTSSTNLSAGSQFASTISGVFAVNGLPLSYTQKVFFDQNSQRINFSVDILNTSASQTATNVVYARGLDPDQDQPQTNQTSNSKTANSVTAAGLPQYSNLFISIVDNTKTQFGVPSIQAPNTDPNSYWPIDPYTILGGGLAGPIYADDSINMAWNIGKLGPGQSYEIDFYYQVGAVPVPPTVILLGSGLLGLAGLRFRRKLS